MSIVDHFRGLTPVQRNTFMASFFGWTLDAFDYFLVTFALSRIAATFGRPVGAVLAAITVTLMFRPIGALVFGYFADRYGRRGPLMVDIVLYSLLELASGFAPSVTAFIAIRLLYGIAMGGEWGLGAALALEAIPAQSRGLFSGLLQQGYAFGYLLAALTYGIAFTPLDPQALVLRAVFVTLATLAVVLGYTALIAKRPSPLQLALSLMLPAVYTFGVHAVCSHFDWRGLFVIGSLPAILVIFIRRGVPESAAFEREQGTKTATRPVLQSLRRQWPLYLYAIVLMTAFNFLSHGTQDLYPLLLGTQHHFDADHVSSIAIIANIGAILGGTVFGALSQNIGRRKAIVFANGIGLLMIPFWALSHSFALLALGGFALQFAVQGAWGVVPAHLNELSPADARGTFPGFTYQIGNFIASGAAQLEGLFASTWFHTAKGEADYGRSLALVAAVAFIAVGVLAVLGPERRSVSFQNLQEDVR